MPNVSSSSPRPFLMTVAYPIRLQDLEGQYNPAHGLTYDPVDDHVPLVIARCPSTELKTYEYPVDDVPDPEDDRCF